MQSYVKYRQHVFTVEYYVIDLELWLYHQLIPVLVLKWELKRLNPQMPIKTEIELIPMTVNTCNRTSVKRMLIIAKVNNLIANTKFSLHKP